MLEEILKALKTKQGVRLTKSFEELNCGLNCGLQLTETHQIILNTMAAYPQITIAKIADKTAYKKRTIETAVAYLQQQGLIVREDGKKMGRWIVRIN